MGDLGEGFCGDLSAATADADQDKEPAADGAERDGESPVEPNPPGPAAVDLVRRQSGLVGAVMKAVLEEVVVVAVLEDPQEATQRSGEKWMADGERERDLEVDQPWPAGSIDEDVLPLVEIDMGDVARVDFGQQPGETRKEVVVDASPVVEDVPFDELASEGVGHLDASGADGAEVGRDPDDAGEPGVEVAFPVGKEPTEPRHGEAENRLAPVELAQRLTGGGSVDRGGCPGVVLEDLDTAERRAVDLHLGGRVCVTEGAEGRRAWSAACPVRDAGWGG